jgi:hypothetical protein
MRPGSVSHRDFERGRRYRLRSLGRHRPAGASQADPWEHEGVCLESYPENLLFQPDGYRRGSYLAISYDVIDVVQELTPRWHLVVSSASGRRRVQGFPSREASLAAADVIIASPSILTVRGEPCQASRPGDICPLCLLESER